MGAMQEGITYEERSMLRQLFGEMRRTDRSASDSELHSRAYYEVMMRSVEGLKRELGTLSWKRVIPALMLTDRY